MQSKEVSDITNYILIIDGKKIKNCPISIKLPSITRTDFIYLFIYQLISKNTVYKITELKKIKQMYVQPKTLLNIQM